MPLEDAMTALSTATDVEIRPFEIAIADAELDDLRRHLDAARRPATFAGNGWERGVPVSYLRRIADHWRNDVRLARPGVDRRLEAAPGGRRRSRPAADHRQHPLVHRPRGVGGELPLRGGPLVRLAGRDERSLGVGGVRRPRWDHSPRPGCGAAGWPLVRVRPRRPLRGDGGTGPVGGRSARLVRRAALELGDR